MLTNFDDGRKSEKEIVSDDKNDNAFTIIFSYRSCDWILGIKRNAHARTLSKNYMR